MPELFDRPRISRATIARLHNRGNYEHSRYEVTVEIPPNADPGSVIREVEDILGDIAPKPPVDAWDLHMAKERLKKPVVSVDPHDESERENARKKIVRYEEWHKAREGVFQRFTALGGVETYTDAKDKWDDDN